MGTFAVHEGVNCCRTSASGHAGRRTLKIATTEIERIDDGNAHSTVVS